MDHGNQEPFCHSSKTPSPQCPRSRLERERGGLESINLVFVVATAAATVVSTTATGDGATDHGNGKGNADRRFARMSLTDVSSDSASLPPCVMCRVKVAIYCCPRCHARTCSLACSRAHKASPPSGGEAVCSGKRDRTRFCSLKGFTDSHLASDYHFLEDVLKVSESSKRIYEGLANGDSSALASGASAAKRARGNNVGPRSGRVKLDSISAQPPAHPLLRAREGKSAVEVLAHGVNDATELNEKQPSHQSSGIVNGLLANKPAATPPPPKKQKVDPLVRQSELKGVNLLRMPSGMERRRSNTTKFNKKKGSITWKVELRFHPPAGGEPSPGTLTVEGTASDSSTLRDALGRHLDVRPGNSTTRARLRTFAAAPRESLALFIKRLPCSSTAPRYFKIDPGATLMESLKGKTIIEFPTIDVVMEADKDRFPLFIGEVS